MQIRQPARSRSRAVAAFAAAGALALSACGQGSGGSGSSGGGDGTAGGKTYDWDMTITTGKTSTWYEGAELFGQVLEEKSGGRMTLNIFPSEQLTSGDQVAGVEMLMEGDKAFSYNSTIVYAGIDPKFGAVNAPFLYEDADEAVATLEATGFDAYKKLAAGHGVELLGFGESGFRQITNNARPILEPADLKGIKLRIPGIGLFTDIFQTLGANPTTMNFAEVFTALQQGTIDGQENPIDVIYSASLNEVQDYLSVWNYVYDPLILGMNRDQFDALTSEDQQIVLDAAAEANELQISSNREKQESQLEELRADMEIVELTPEQVAVFQEAVDPLYGKYQEVWGEDLAKALQPQN